VQREIHGAESDLTHLRVPARKVFGASFSGYRSSGMAGRFPNGAREIERFRSHTSLHDLRGSSDEIPRDAGSGEAADFDAAQEVMQQMAEFVKNRFASRWSGSAGFP